MYKGYIATNGKRALQKFKDGDGLLDLETARKLNEFSGILGNNTVLIDVDDEAQATALFNVVVGEKVPCKVYKTSRGAHFMFWNNGRIDKNYTHCKLALGVEADIKLGCRASYQVIKMGGVEREVIYDTENYTTVPKWLLPVKTGINVFGIKEGDGRNDALFRLILPLQAGGLTVEEVKDCVRLINKYIVGDKLSENEIDMILRDSAFKKESEKFEFDSFSKFLIKKYSIIKINGVLHSYKDGIYVNDELEHIMVQEIPNLSRSKRYEVLSYLDVVVRESQEQCDGKYVAFANGILDITTGNLEPFDREKVLLNKIPWNYDPDCYDELMDKSLDQWAAGDATIRAVLEEMVGFTLYRKNEIGKAFVLLGDKSNGKSTFLSVLQHMLGEDNVSSLDIKDLGDRFRTAELFGKLANIGDDISDNFISDSSIFKKLVTGNRVTAERKGRDPFQFDNYSKLIFSANNIPRIKDKTGAVQRRLIIIPFLGRFDGGDPGLKYKLLDGVEYLIKLGVEGMRRVLDKGFTTSELIEEKGAEYARENNPLIGFLNEEIKIENEACADIYDKYLSYCVVNNHHAVGRNRFYGDICAVGGFKISRPRFDGNRVRRFVRAD